VGERDGPGATADRGDSAGQNSDRALLQSRAWQMHKSCLLDAGLLDGYRMGKDTGAIGCGRFRNVVAKFD
jgi:hypothetical protein